MSTTVQNIQWIRRSIYHEKNTTITTTFGGIEYLLDQTAVPLSFLPSRSLDGFFNTLKGDLRPCTLINWREEIINRRDLDDIVSEQAVQFAGQDDVWTSPFLDGETSYSHETALEHRLH